MKRYLKVFLLSFFLLFIILLILGIYPFSDKTLIVTDLRDQYLIFINYLKNIFLGTNSLFYTFSGSLGENLYPLSSYYLMSIFNIFTLPFKGNIMPLVLTIIIMVKISLSSVCMLYFLDKRNEQKSSNYLFAISYGLMSYNMAFYFHIMWLDAIILLPLVALGIENIFTKKSSKLYIISLSLTIISNYYFGFIVCIFSVIYFIYYYLINKNSDIKKIIFKYLLSSFLSGMIAMFILLPNILVLASSRATMGNNIEVIPRFFNTIEILSKSITLSFDSESIWHGGPNIFVGTFITLLIIAYFFNKKVDKRKKVITLSLLIILFLICRIHPLDLIFHGLIEPNCFDFRQAFIISFLLIVIGYEGFNNLEKIDKQSIIIVILIVVHLIIYFFNLSYFSGIKGLYLLLSLVISTLLIYSINKKYYKLLLGIVIVDLMINGINIIGTISYLESRASNISKYQEYYKNNEEVIGKIKELDNSFYRMEKDYHFSNSINDSMLFNYAGISHFDSTMNVNTEKLLENLGFRRVVSRAFYGNGSTKAVDMLLGIKYVLSNNKHFDYPVQFNLNNINVLKNEDFISPIYLFNKQSEINYNENVFDNLNNLFYNLTGINNLYKKTEYAINYHNVKRIGDKYIKINDDSYIEYKFYPQKDMNYYLYFIDNLVRDNYKNADIYFNDVTYSKYFTKYNYSMINLGMLNDEVTIKIVLNDDELVFKDGLIYYEDNNLLKEVHDKLINNSEIKLDKSKLKVNVDNKYNTHLLITIPYEKGWNILVDNKKTDYENYGGFITFKLDKGKHDIELSFQPNGLKWGIIISLISLLSSIYLIHKESYEKKDQL